MKTLLLFLKFISCSYLCQYAQAQQPISVKFNANRFHPGDSIYFDVKVMQPQLIPKVATLRLKIVELASKKEWNYRYPLINDNLSAALKIDSAMTSGNYAFNFIVQKSFFQLLGKLNMNLPSKKKQPFINYLFILKNKESVADIVQLGIDHQFKIGNLLFQDTANIIFSIPGVSPEKLDISIQTPLDSSFNPIAVATSFININRNLSNDVTVQMGDTLKYHFQHNYDQQNSGSDEVVVVAKQKKRLEDFKSEYVSALYNNFDEIEINGIDDEELSKSSDLLNYLITKAAGLRVMNDAETGGRYLSWRKKKVDIYIDEVRLDEDAIYGIHPADIALIRLIRPGTPIGMSSGDGGAIMIYLKTAEYMSSSGPRKYKFRIIGYQPLDAVWK